MDKVRYLKSILVLIFLSYLFFMLGNGVLSLSNPDEVFYAQTAKEMIKYRSWLTPYLFGQPQFEKPIFLFWLLRIGFILFGISSFAARFFPALFATMGVLSIYFLGLLGFKDEKKAFISSLILMSCGFYVGLARTLFTDMIFSVFILMSLTSFFWGYLARQNKIYGIMLFSIFSGLAVLTKGPLGFLIPFLTIALFLLIKNEIKFILDRYSLWGILIFALVSMPWYIFMIHRYGHNFTHEFFYNDHFRRIIEAEHAGNDRWYFYPLSIIGCFFPWSLFLLASLIFLPSRLIKKADSFHVFLTCWIIVVFFIFQFAHSKLTSYIFPLFPTLAVITAGFIYDAISTTKRSRLISPISLGTSFILLLIPIGLNIAMAKYPAYLSSKIPVYGFIIAFLALIIAMLILVLRNKILKYMYSLALVMPLFLSVIPFMRNDIELHLSSRRACEYLLKNYPVNNKILSSKMFVRGVKYYADKDVAVIDISGHPFFSAHPIPFLDSDQKVADFLRRQAITYCILRKSSVEDIKRITVKDFNYTVLDKIGNAYILKIESLINSRPIS
jgi:4-amino-4-deoxy-L-arabinose transferase-like glycosyltransferase